MKAEILIGDALSKLKTLDDQSVHCVITSPPYWGLRAYHGDTGMIGLEPTWEEHLAGLMAVFDEVWRVLRKDGTLFVNYGDAYTGGGRGKGSDLSGTKQATNAGSLTNVPINHLKKRTPAMRSKTKTWDRDDKMEQHFAYMDGLPAKSLMMMPARFALAMQEAGWILRSEIVWAKKNCMPESVTDRPVSSHEKIFMFSRQKKYYYDHIAVRTQEKESSNKLWPGIGIKHANERNRGESSKPMQVNPGANMRKVLHLASSPYKDAHIATYPPALI